MVTKKYTVPIDKELCKEVLTKPMDTLNEKHIAEVKKVFNVIIRNYYADMKYDEEELFYENFTKMLETRDKYNPEFCAYNYIYTGFRYNIGNERVSRKKVVITEEAPADREVVTWERNDEEDALLEILSGWNEVTELTSKQVFNLLFADSVIAPKTADSLVSFILKLNREAPRKITVKVKVITCEGRQIRKIITGGTPLYVVKDLWEEIQPDRIFKYKKLRVPVVTEASLFLNSLGKAERRALVSKLLTDF